MKIQKQSILKINVRKPEDLGQVVATIQKAAIRAGRHGSVTIQILAADGSVLPGSEAQAEELLQAQHKIVQLEAKIVQLEAKVEQLSKAPEAPTINPGSENKPPAKKVAEKTVLKR